MADDGGDLHKLHGLLEAMLGEQVHLGQSLDLHLQNVEGGRLEENGHLSEDEKMQSILRHLQGVETEGSKLKHDLQILTASQHGQNLTEAYDEQLERLKEDVTRMAHTQQETETHLTELGHVLSACLAGLEQRSPAPSGPAVGPRTAPSFCSFTLFIYFYLFIYVLILFPFIDEQERQSLLPKWRQRTRRCRRSALGTPSSLRRSLRSSRPPKKVSVSPVAYACKRRTRFDTDGAPLQGSKQSRHWRRPWPTVPTKRSAPSPLGSNCKPNSTKPSAP